MRMPSISEPATGAHRGIGVDTPHDDFDVDADAHAAAATGMPGSLPNIATTMPVTTQIRRFRRQMIIAYDAEIGAFTYF